jgi:hypothetical protein
MATIASEADTQRAALDAYFRAGEARALALGNRGPMRFTADGKLAPEILDGYAEHGFYVLEGVFAPEEVAAIKAEMHAILERLPVAPGAEVDRNGNPALGLGLPLSPFHWSKPLGDPMGATEECQRAPVKMIELAAAADKPKEVVYIVRAPLQFSDAALRGYAHPALLALAEAINGEDFVPFSEGFIVKKPGEGAAFAWHQDGTTHWDSPDWDGQTHGFNYMTQLYPSTAANGVWFVPGSHNHGKLDIAALVDAAGGNLLPDAVPLICQPGDVAISNRQIVHGSFANDSPDWRVSFNTGFHRYSSVLGARGHNNSGADGYDAERIRKRAEMIGYAIDARRQYYPNEAPFDYRPHSRAGKVYRWSEDARAEIDGYYMRDLNI